MEKEVMELPKLKVVSKKEITIFDEDLALIYDMTPKQRVNYFICLGIFCFIVGVISFFLLSRYKVFSKENFVNILDISVNSYDINNNTAKVSITPSTEQESCIYINDSVELKGKVKDGKCLLDIDLVQGNVKFIDKRDRVSKSLVVDNFVVDLKEEKKYYLPLAYELELGKEMIAVGKPNIIWSSVSENVQIVENKLKAKKVGKASVVALINGKIIHELEVVVTDTIIAMPNKFNDKKPYLPCDEYTLEESQLLDQILEYRIESAGYQTRAGAVAAARFLTLEFPYRIAYYWETGRLNNTGKAYMDGEGRYYHKGLYLHESKKADIVASGNGPQIWGCKMRCYEDDPPYFYPGKKYPNGLDCSGFVTWVLYNAGFDVGDRGAGESPGPYQLTDLGEFTTVTSSLIKSGKIKPGDLFNYWGHISILVGEDENNYYIAESLNTFGGVVIRTYSKKNVMKTFKYVVLMDEVYKKDGNLTDLWY